MIKLKKVIEIAVRSIAKFSVDDVEEYGDKTLVTALINTNFMKEVIFRILKGFYNKHNSRKFFSDLQKEFVKLHYSMRMWPVLAKCGMPPSVQSVFNLEIVNINFSINNVQFCCFLFLKDC